ncbi:MAG: ABC transporter permease subunit [Armatimonadetes bacterium]|nr:ABC transporter permease subunit [Anaerolineae bacterium]
MSSIFAVYKRELTLYFRSPVAYAIAFALFLLFGLLFSSNINNVVEYNLTSAQQGGAPVTAESFIGFVPSLLTFLLFLVAPLLTMRLLAEETREGTLEVLMTLPMSEASFIIGKFLAVWTYYTIVLLITLVTYTTILSQIGVPDMGRVLLANFGAWLYGGAVLAVTMVWSAITEDQIVAAFLGAATVLVLYLAEIASTWASQQTFTAGATSFIRELSLTAHFDNTMLAGILRVEDVLYFVFLMVGALFITVRLVETRRWRA